MVTPFHQYASVHLDTTAAAAHERLMAGPEDLAATATGVALSRIEPLLRLWGLSPTTLPTVSAEATEPDTFGSLEMRWSGDEDATLWPSLSARLLVIPAHPSVGARIVLLSPRSPEAELTTHRLDRPHRRRVVNVAIQRFLHEMAAQLAEPGPVPTIGPGVTSFDRQPQYVHHVRGVAVDPDELVNGLADDPQRLATEATTAALAAAAETLAGGRFRSPPAPRVSMEEPTAGQLGVLRLRWDSDEEATGWPAITLALVVEAGSAGSRLVVLATRKPGYDLSTNRIDKHPRDQVIRDLGAHVADSVLHSTVPAAAAPEPDLQVHSIGVS